MNLLVRSEGGDGPTKSALKKAAKEAEKARKKAEKAAKAKELEQAQAAADEVFLLLPEQTQAEISLAGLCCRQVRQTPIASVSIATRSHTH